jgi:hypothetical protein
MKKIYKKMLVLCIGLVFVQNVAANEQVELKSIFKINEVI